MYETVCQNILNKEVILAHEDNFPDRLLLPENSAKTLIYRLAMYEDININCYSLFDKIFKNKAIIVNSFASEIRSNKKWFALFHDPIFRNVLTETEQQIIYKFIPYTGYLTTENINSVLKDKDNYVFKKNRSYGGHSILIGKELDSYTLQQNLKDLSLWTFQKLIECSDFILPLDDSFKLTTCKVVLGLFLIHEQNMGILIRASDKNAVVSVATGGAHIGWMLPMMFTQRDEFINALAIPLEALDSTKQKMPQII